MEDQKRMHALYQEALTAVGDRKVHADRPGIVDVLGHEAALALGSRMVGLPCAQIEPRVVISADF